MMLRIPCGRRCLVVGNKADLPGQADVPVPFHAVSSTTRQGIRELRDKIHAIALPQLDTGGETAFVTNIRHERLLREALTCLRQAEGAVTAGIPHEMILLDLYDSLRPIDQITGTTTIEDILRKIFSTFCIGK
jgi:tRNA modification GTPase